MNYEEAKVNKLINTQLNKLKSSAKNNTETTLRITKKTFLNDFNNNILIDIKLSKTQLSKMIQPVRFLGKT